jgi:hypothetical protein
MIPGFAVPLWTDASCNWEGARVINTIEVVDQAGALAYTFEDLMRYHGGDSPGVWRTR